ncbi:MAG TPA: hypothetical protein VEZ71_14450, partial [Archangium sp.]|nr:hypothetical protein [Archangium sp.]
MKVLEFYGVKPEDSLLLTFDGAFNPQVALQVELAPFLQELEECADGWMPDVVKGKRQRKYARAAVWKALEERRGERYTHCGLYRTQWPALSLSLGIRLPPHLPGLNIMVGVKPLSFFAEAERCRQFVEMVRAWASHYPVTYAEAHSLDDMELAGSPLFGRDEKTSRENGFDK